MSRTKYEQQHGRAAHHARMPAACGGMLAALGTNTMPLNLRLPPIRTLTPHLPAGGSKCNLPALGTKLTSTVENHWLGNQRGGAGVGCVEGSRCYLAPVARVAGEEAWPCILHMA